MFTDHSDTPIDETNWGLRPEPKRLPEGDFYKWVLIPGRPIELYRRPMTCFGRTWQLATWSRKLLTTPRKLHVALVDGMRAGKTIREIIVMDLNADMARVLGNVRKKRASDAEGVQQTPDTNAELLHARLTAIKKRGRETLPTPRRLTRDSTRLTVCSAEQNGEDSCLTND